MANVGCNYYAIPSMKTVAAFDFDGTITFRDTLLPFLLRFVGLRRLIYSIARASPLLVLYLIGKISNEQAKERLIFFALRGKRVEIIRGNVVEWVKTIRMRPEMLERIRWHKSNGHYCVLVSASVDVYVEEMANYLNFNDFACTGLSVDNKGLLTGFFSTPNCWGEQKVHRLQEIVGPLDQVMLYAYGDSAGDLPMLRVAQYAWMRGKVVFKGC